MAGNREGGIKTRDKHLAINPNFYQEIGSIGGKAKVPKGFAVNRELARTAGMLGGRIGGKLSKKGKANAGK